MDDKEKDLMEWLRHDEHAAFRAIYDKFSTPLFLYAYKLIHNREEAQDIVAMQFAKFWEKRTDFAHIANLKAYLYMMVRNACLDYLKSINRHRSMPLSSEETPEEMYSTFRAELFSKVMAEIEKLTPREQTVLKLSLQGLSDKEIAGHLRISVKRVYNVRSEAVKKLRIRLSAFFWISLPLLEKLLRTCFLETSSATPELF